MSITFLSAQLRSSLTVVNSNGIMCSHWLPTAITLHHQWMPLSLHLQNYCRYVGDQPGRLIEQELKKKWKLHAKLLAENRITKPVINKKVTKASDLKIGQPVLIKIIGNAYLTHHISPTIK